MRGAFRTLERTSYALVSLEAKRTVRSFTAGNRLTSNARSPFPSSSSPASTALNRLLGGRAQGDFHLCIVTHERRGGIFYEYVYRSKPDDVSHWFVI